MKKNMAHKHHAISFLLLFFAIDAKNPIVFRDSRPYLPTWDSLDSRPLPTWYDQSKIGIFLHWGVFSVPSFGDAWFWHSWKTVKDPRFVQFMKKFYPSDWTYADFAPQFRAEFFDPEGN